MAVYLDADCVLQALMDEDIVKPENWKKKIQKDIRRHFITAEPTAHSVSR